MKIAISLPLFAVASLYELLYLQFYSIGALGALPFICILRVIALALPLPCLMIWSMLQLRRNNTRRWLIGVGAAFILFVGAVAFVLPPPGFITVYGFRDSLMDVATLDDLREVARDIDKDKINLPDRKASEFSEQQKAAYQALQEKFPFLKLRFGGDGPKISEHDGVITLMWGGSWAGGWGFSVALSGSLPDHEMAPFSRWIRASNDIYFFALEG